jgi:hypothetical protein
LSFAFNDSEEKLETMTEALNEAYQQQNDRINQLQILFLFAHYISFWAILSSSQSEYLGSLGKYLYRL